MSLEGQELSPALALGWGVRAELPERCSKLGLRWQLLWARVTQTSDQHTRDQVVSKTTACRRF